MAQTHFKLIVLDRDGAIGQGAEGDADGYLRTPEHWVPREGSPEAIARLNQAGYTVAVACNQPGLGRGLFDMGALNAVHERMHRLLANAGARIDAVFFCPHAPDEGCACRKPLPGLLVQMGQRYGLQLAGVPVVGDSLSDMQAAAAVQCAPHLLTCGNAKRYEDASLPTDFPAATRVHADLRACVDSLLAA